MQAASLSCTSERHSDRPQVKELDGRSSRIPTEAVFPQQLLPRDVSSCLLSSPAFKHYSTNCRSHLCDQLVLTAEEVLRMC